MTDQRIVYGAFCTWWDTIDKACAQACERKARGGLTGAYAIKTLLEFADEIRALPLPTPSAFDLIEHLRRQKDFSLKTFGPGARTKGVLDHIRKELAEIEAEPDDITEWVDVIILAFDGAWRAGWEAPDIVRAIVAKQTKNESRVWPDWRTSAPDKAIEHDRSHDKPLPTPSAPDHTEALRLAREALKQSYKTSARAFNRIHGLPRTSDTELADEIEQTRHTIETALAALDKLGGQP